MIVKAPEERFPTAPEGTFLALCVDEIDLGKVKTSFGGEERERNMVRLVWQIEEQDREGKPYLIKQDYTASLDEKAKLRKHLQSWRGRAFSAPELLGFDLETIVGAGCMLSIVHATGRKGGTFANVEAVMKLPKGQQPPAKGPYVRTKDRKVDAAAALVSGPRRQQQKPPEEQPPDIGAEDYGDPPWQDDSSSVPF